MEGTQNFQVVFTTVSSAEISRLPQLMQIEILKEFDVLSGDYLEKHRERFGIMRRDKREVYRYRAGDYRIYFERTGEGVRVLRVLNKNSLKDFLFRSDLPGSEDSNLENHPGFWEMMDDHHGEK